MSRPGSAPPGGPDGPGPLDGFAAIAEALEEPAGRATFARGAILGAMVGAAIVGSVLRFRRERRSSAARRQAGRSEGAEGSGGRT